MLNDFLRHKRAIILEKWFDLILESYHPESTKFFRQERNQFANPVGRNIANDIEMMYDAVLSDGNDEQMTPSVEGIVKIRAVQDFTPSQAVGFVFLLKKVIRAESNSETWTQQDFSEWSVLESSLDNLALLAFDLYSQCREKIYRIRIGEIKTRSHKLLEKTDFFRDIT